MTLYTTNFALPYPDGTNRPCDFDADWCTFTDAVQVVLDRFQAIADRTNPVLPVARLLVTTAVTIANGVEIPFDTVSVDTAGWVDFDADPAGITTDRVGIFVAHGNARFSSTTLNNFTDVKIRYTNQIQIPDDFTLDRAQGVPTGPNVATLAAVTGLTRWSLVAGSSSGSNIVVEAADFSVFWHADRAAP